MTRQGMGGKETFVLAHGVITDGKDLFLEDGAVLIEGEIIKHIGSSEDLIPMASRVFDLGGRILLPGLLNPHHHLYSSFATGLAPLGRTDTFKEILQNLWWHLDSLLDEETLYYSALSGAMDAVRYGVTSVFDHHASMNCVRGSLDLVAKALDEVGIRGVLCFETSDRMGPEQVDEHIRENLNFWAEHRYSDNFSGAFGLHANLTLSEGTLSRISQAKPPEMPIHAHCGESPEDLHLCLDMGYEGPVDRFSRWGLVNENSLLIHAIHLSAKDYQLIHDIGPYVITNPESNANNRVGAMDRARIPFFLIGTDGMSSDMIQSLRSMYLLGKGNQESFPELANAFFRNSSKALGTFFPSTGVIREGFSADLAVMDYIPMTPISMENLMGHLIFGAKGGRMWMTLARGRILWHEGHFLHLDEERIIHKLREAAQRLHRLFYQ